VTPGFGHPATDAQIVFRAILEAMAHPGRIVPAPAVVESAPEGLNPAAAAVCLALLDGDTAVWTDLPALAPALPWLRFHCGCPITADSREAEFGVVTEVKKLSALDLFHPGTDEMPESAATLILQVDALTSDGGRVLRGPGIPGSRRLEAAGLHDGFWRQRRMICGSFPIGLDVIFVSGGHLAGLPRTTIIDR
jgi:alpha-D-ribose 1-methylphosphonate 5-triphosphate synthase subunit PhnH